MKLRKSLAAFMIAFAVGASVSVGWAEGSSAADQDLPELGSPANAAVSLEDEYQAGLGWFRQMGQGGTVLEDPEGNSYIQQIGHTLSSRAEEGQHQFYSLVVRDPFIHAFATARGSVAL